MLSARLARPAMRIAPRGVRHQHQTFEPSYKVNTPPYPPAFIGALTVGILSAGFWVIYGGALFQNKKHGFPQKK
ncbi:hypothetical protein TeGR_g2936 [Tetraparma gracilis]|uniref:Uncharacterized protein n=1 Tax=Tetraparma gracilis TaxID=2962635 RepID=A0ABQ6MRQ0_9STRA|nr:hypothetical protein TeGR_g2936 [Tetraparma gracilis]